MFKLIKMAGIIVTAFTMCFSQQIKNITFKDMKGKSYDLYNILGQGKYVYVMASFIG